MSTTKVSVFAMAMAFVGTIIGAGYASGQELMQFFGNFGPMSTPGLICSAVFFFLYAALCMVVSKRMNTDNYAEVMSPARNPIFMLLVDIAIFSFLFGIFVIMIAGSSALFTDQFALPDLVGGGILLAITILSTWWGLSSILSGFKLAVPVLLVGTAIIALIAIFSPQVDPNATAAPAGAANALIGNWFVSSALYVFYNMLPGLCVLIPLGFTINSQSKIIQGAGLGALLLSGLGFLLVAGIVKNYALVSSEPMPMLTLAKGLSPMVGYAYALFMFAAIFSTALGLMYGKLARLKNAKWYNAKYDHAVIVGLSVLGLVLSKVGFVTLVATVYPFYGYISGIILLGLIFNFFYYAPKKNG